MPAHIREISPSGGIDAGAPLGAAGQIEYLPGSIVSRTLMKGPAGVVTLMAFDSDQEIGDHATPCDAMVMVLDGVAEVTVDGRRARVAAGEMTMLPADAPHSLHAPQRFKMLLIMLRK